MKYLKLKHAFFVINLLIMTSLFNSNSFNTVSPTLFKNFQIDSESLIIGRLIKSKNDGVFSEGGFLGWNHPNESLLKKETKVVFQRFGGWGYEVPYKTSKYLYQYDTFENNYNVRAYEKYFSQTGGQALIYNLLGRTFGITENELISLCHFLNSFLLAIILSFFLMWITTNFGILPSLVSLILIIFSQWTTVFANNMLYVTGLFFFPMVCNLWYLHFSSIKNTFCLKKLSWLTLFTISLKCTVSGFDFIIPTLVMTITPLIYYSFIKKQKLIVLFKHSIFLSFVALTGVLISLLILTIQLAIYHESWNEALNYLIHTTERRTYGNQQDLSNIVYQNEHVSLLNILDLYLNEIAIDLSHLSSIKITFKSLFSLLFLFSTIIPLTNLKINRQLLGLTIIVWLSLIGPIAWFVIFKYHTITHIHMNLIIWYLPSLLFGSALIGYIIQQGFLSIWLRVTQNK